MTKTLTRSPFTTETVTETALKTAQKRPDFWVGYSGETLTGAETAAFLDATRAVLENAGWTRTATDGPDIPEPDESMTLKTMLITLWRYAREAISQSGPLTLLVGMYRVESSDAMQVSIRVLDALVAAHTGTSTAQAIAWADRPNRTWSEVRDLLTAGSEFARTHGPH